MGERFYGNVNATEDNIRMYLCDNYVMPDGSEITRERAAELAAKHPDEAGSAVRLSSFAHYPGDRIADAEGLLYIETDPTSDYCRVGSHDKCEYGECECGCH